MKLRIRGDELRRRRLEKFLSQEELGERADLSGSAISKLELGNEGVRGKTVRALATALECDPEDISAIVAEEVPA